MSIVAPVMHGVVEYTDREYPRHFHRFGKTSEQDALHVALDRFPVDIRNHPGIHCFERHRVYQYVFLSVFTYHGARQCESGHHLGECE